MPTSHDLSVENLRIHDHVLAVGAETGAHVVKTTTSRSGASHAISARPPTKPPSLAASRAPSKAPSRAPSKAASKAATQPAKEMLEITVIEEEEPLPPKALSKVSKHSHGLSHRFNFEIPAPAPLPMELVRFSSDHPSIPAAAAKSVKSSHSHRDDKSHHSVQVAKVDGPEDGDVVKEITIKRTLREGPDMVDVEVEEVREVTRRSYKMKVPAQGLKEMRFGRRGFEE